MCADRGVTYDSPIRDNSGIPCPSCQASGVVARKLSVPRNIPGPEAANRRAWGANGFAAIKEPKVICVTPMSRASFCAP
jgi:hypothetical protein